MRIDFNASAAGLTLTVALFALHSPTAAQTGDYYAGKTLRIVNLNPHLREIFKMVSFDRIFQLE